MLETRTSRTVTLGAVYKTLGRGSLLAAPMALLVRGGLLDVQPLDPLVFGTVAGVLLAAGWLGCILPALRATRVDPQGALAAE